MCMTGLSDLYRMETRTGVHYGHGQFLHRGTELSCCEKQAFNPKNATCCEVVHGNRNTGITVTIYLSQPESKDQITD